MALSSSSTYDQAVDEYLDTADYFQAESVSKALRHAVAIRHLLIKQPSSSTKGANSVTFRVDLLHDELKRAEEYSWARTGSRVVRASFREMRNNG